MDGTKTFGLSSQEEMCVALIAYYPRKLLFGQLAWFCATGIDTFEQCNADYETSQLDSVLALDRKFDAVSPGGCPDLAGNPSESPDIDLSPSSSNGGSSHMICLLMASLILSLL
jgi:hypothetical protein